MSNFHIETCLLVINLLAVCHSCVPNTATRNQNQAAPLVGGGRTPTTTPISITTDTPQFPYQFVSELQPPLTQFQGGDSGPHSTFAGYNSIYPGAGVGTGANANVNVNNFPTYTPNANAISARPRPQYQNQFKSVNANSVSVNSLGEFGIGGGSKIPAISSTKPPQALYPVPVRNVSSISIDPHGDGTLGYYYDSYEGPLSIDQENEHCPPQNPRANEALVVEFFQRTFGDKNLEGLERYLRRDYIQHNPMVADGLDAFRDFLQSPVLRSRPRMKLDIKRVSADGDLVWVHMKLGLGGRNNAVVDIFRIQCGKIAEHWDVIQEITPRILRTAKNSHPFF